MSGEILPSYLLNTEPLEPTDLPLQVALLTMELAQLRQVVTLLAARAGEPGPPAVPDYGVM